MFIIDRDFCLRYIVPHLFTSQLVNITVLRQILIKLHQYIDYSSRISVWIERKEIFELILNLELERIISNKRQPSTITTRPYLLMIKGCSEDLHIYLIEYLRLFVDVKIEIENSIKEKFLAIIIKWITKCWISIENTHMLSMKFYEYIFTFLYNPQFPEVQKPIFDALKSLFIFLKSREENILLQQIVSSHLINVINSYMTYSEDILSIYLLAFCNYLLKLNESKKMKEVSNEILNIFIHLFRNHLD
ncbi:unnamed protein product [Rotaria sordida]|uniref:Uncharacterized protein n=2 Tax=Rotaria sordida TaxID=392033 RepID=A0A814YIH7_9BILA|nr:unnamed protein product [Rotaria sordida]CAF1516323.1 unnamed protein product [Rotaria sordida]CAF4155428.1 unnamed protein product [Rotaria sordida]